MPVKTKSKIMEIVCISDTHGLHETMKASLPTGDMIIHAGDCSNVGHPGGIAYFFDWYSALPYKYKILIAGNHDIGFQNRFEELEKILKETGITYLQDSFASIDGVKIFGSPWTLEFNNWAFMTNETGLEEIYKEKIPAGLRPDIIVTHGAVKGYLDSTGHKEEHLGSNALFKSIEKNVPKYVIHGHIHGGYGKHKLNKNTTLVNASICNENYDPVNKPIVIEIENSKEEQQ